MSYLEQFQTNIYALIVLVVLFFVMTQRLRVWTYGKKILFIVMIVTALGILSDILSWVFDGMSFFGAYFLEYSTNVVLFIVAPILSSMMLAYVKYRMIGTYQNLFKMILRFIPLWITIGILIVNIFTPLYFSISRETNSYTAGDYVWIHYVMLSIVYIYMTIVTIRYRKQAEPHIAPTFIIFFLLPMIGMVIQILYIDVFYSWSFIVLSILVIFIFLESADGEIDFLTKLFNRQSYEAYIKQLIQEDKPFNLLYLDLDRFKEINDRYGHLAGDKVLIAFGQILQTVFPNDMVVRLGGDEFIVVVEQDCAPDDIIVQIREQVSRYDKPVSDLDFSIGCQPYEAGMTVDEIYSAVDQNMYLNKRKNKKLRRRSTD